MVNNIFITIVALNYSLRLKAFQMKKYTLICQDYFGSIKLNMQSKCFSIEKNERNLNRKFN